MNIEVSTWMVVNLVNMNLGAPYVAIINRLIALGYAASATEAVRQALKIYAQEVSTEHVMSEEEARLVKKAADAELAKWRAAGKPSYTWEEVKAELEADRKAKALSSGRKRNTT